MDSYTTTLQQLTAFPKTGKEQPNLERMQRLSALLGHPEKAFATLHVAGTNGKGSVCTKLASSLNKAGYLTGLYTSPHISSFRERIQIANKLISQEETTFWLNSIYKLLHEHAISLTFFEVTTLLAFLCFRAHKVDIAVIETGIGGSYDATNIVTPLVSVITSIGYDHMDMLGPSLDDISAAKAGIIKKGVPVVLGPDIANNVIQKRAKDLGCTVHQSTLRSHTFDEENTAIAKLTLDILGFPLPKEALEFGLLTKPPCRFERHLYDQQEIVFDVAHNAHGFARLLQQLEHTFPHLSYRFVLGFSKGKNITQCAELIQHKASAVHLVDSQHPHLAKVIELEQAFTSASCTIHVENSVTSGVHQALRSKDPAVLVIAGSFFIMHEAKKTLGIHTTEDI